MSFHVDSKENVYLITVVTVLCFWMLENLKMQSYAEFTLTNPIFPTASLWWLSTWHTKALQRCTAILWMDSSCLAGSRIFSSSWLTRLYWNSSSSGILKLHRVKQQFLWTWCDREVDTPCLQLKMKPPQVWKQKQCRSNRPKSFN